MALLTFSGCNTITIKDQVWYADKGALGALELHTLNAETHAVDKPSWDTLRFGMLCTDYKTFGDNKANLEKLCSQLKHCKFEQIQEFLDLLRSTSLVNEQDRP
jgi:hypothetical protein